MEDFRDTRFNPPFVKLMYEMRKAEAERDANTLAAATAEINQCFDRIEKELADKEYLAGTFSMADIAFMANFDLLERLQVPIDSKYSNTTAWIARLKARPSFAASAT
jgi:glutathione S-transferase